MRTDADADLVVVASIALAVSVRVPFLALDVTVTVSVAVPLPPDNEVGLTLTETPVVAPLAVRLTLPLYPWSAVSVTVYVVDTLPLDGRLTDFELGEMPMLKLGAAGAETTSVADVVCVKVPSVPEIVKL